MQDYTIIDTVRVHPTHLTVTSRKVYDTPRARSNSSQLENLKKNTHRNLMSQKSVSKCKKAINYLLLQASDKRIIGQISWKDFKFKLCFVTLTLPATQMHTDNQLKRDLLNPFLINAKRHWNVEQYVWRAERQKNGNLHFHIVLDKFIPWQELRSLWNHLLNSLGYIQAYRENQKEWHKNGFRPRPEMFSYWPLKAQQKAYFHGLQNNFSDPNSTDIHSVALVNNVAAYVTKYMTKDYICKHIQCLRHESPLKRQIKQIRPSVSAGALKFLRVSAQIGRIWGCSVELSNLNGGAAVIDSEIGREIARIKSHPKTKAVDEAYYSVYVASIQTAIQLKCVNIVQLLSEFVVEHFILKPKKSDIPIYSLKT